MLLSKSLPISLCDTERERDRQGREGGSNFVFKFYAQSTSTFVSGRGKEVATLFPSGFALFVVKCFELSKG